MKLESYHQMDYVLVFLMGLNESFSQVRSQILLIDPLPSISKVFSMNIQDERQRQIVSQSAPAYSPDGMAFAVKGDFNKFSSDGTKRVSDHNRFLAHHLIDSLATDLDLFPSITRKSTLSVLLATFMDIPWTIVTRSMAIPLGFKSKKPRPQPSSQPASIHQVYNSQNTSENDIKVDTVVNNTNGNFFQSLDKSQHNQVMNMFANHMFVMNVSQDEPRPYSFSFHRYMFFDFCTIFIFILTLLDSGLRSFKTYTFKC